MGLTGRDYMRLPRMTAEGSGFYPCLYFRAKARKNVYPACFEAPGDHLSPAPDAIIVHLLPRHFDHNPLATAPEAKAKRAVAKIMRRASPFSMYDSDGPNAFRLITTSAGDYLSDPIDYASSTAISLSRFRSTVTPKPGPSGRRNMPFSSGIGSVSTVGI